MIEYIKGKKREFIQIFTVIIIFILNLLWFFFRKYSLYEAFLGSKLTPTEEFLILNVAGYEFSRWLSGLIAKDQLEEKFDNLSSRVLSLSINSFALTYLGRVGEVTEYLGNRISEAKQVKNTCINTIEDPQYHNDYTARKNENDKVVIYVKTCINNGGTWVDIFSENTKSRVEIIKMLSAGMLADTQLMC